jgi:hypothetical protein
MTVSHVCKIFWHNIKLALENQHLPRCHLFWIILYAYSKYIFIWRPDIICFKIKNPPTLHSTSKIQPTTSPTFVFGVFASVGKKWGYEGGLLTVVLGRGSSCFLFSFYYVTQKWWYGSYHLFVHNNYFVLRK